MKVLRVFNESSEQPFPWEQDQVQDDLSGGPEHSSVRQPQIKNLTSAVPQDRRDQYESDPMFPTEVWNKTALRSQQRYLELQELPGSGTTATGRIFRIVCVSDTHGRTAKMPGTPLLPEGDLLIHAGDISNKGKREEVFEFLDWFRSQPHRHKVWIAGNHDLTLDREAYRNASKRKRFGLKEEEAVALGGNDVGVAGVVEPTKQATSSSQADGPSVSASGGGLFESISNFFSPKAEARKAEAEEAAHDAGAATSSEDKLSATLLATTHVRPEASKLEAEIRGILEHDPSTFYLHDELLQLEIPIDTQNPQQKSQKSLNIYGSPYQPEFGDWAFNLKRGPDSRTEWDKIPTETDILITHGPPLGRGDFCSSGLRAGCLDLLETVQNRVKPTGHVFGHIHEGYGGSFDGETLFVNAATCNLAYAPNNPPVVVEVMI
ncbi:unnamed protein product [Amoebophrya sp. A120]|nr:unnamed protein product [Amoebophrya sp. A120]|eukprot:GSA120T00007773001.1